MEYNLLEALSIKEKRNFLEKHMNQSEKEIYKILLITIIIGSFSCLMYTLTIAILYRNLNLWVAVMTFAVILGGIIRQKYRSFLLAKYSYKNEKTKT